LKVTVVKQEALIDSNVVGLNKLKVHYVLEGQLLTPPEEGKTTISVVDPVVGWNEVESKGHAASVEGDIPGDLLKVVYGHAGEQPHAHHDDSHGEEQLMSMVTGELTLSALLATLGTAFVLGALHALTPGHGKTLVAAYLVGSRGTVGQAVLLGIVVTITHTLSVFLLGIACLFAFQYVVPEKVIPWLGFFSGLLVTAVGLALIWARATGRELFHGHSHENGHGHSHGHSHSHESEHSHSHESGHSHSHRSDPCEGDDPIADGPREREAEELSHHSHAHHEHAGATELTSEPSTRSPDSPKERDIGLWALISLGVSGGMVPCPEALVVLLGAISLNRLVLGMAVLVAFSLGLASLLILVGIFVVLASKKASSKYYPSEETIRRVSIVAYCFICILGLAIAIRSLTSAGILVINL
jgi:ABC-type nickel/cobalt efflux system permease component RcnA